MSEVSPILITGAARSGTSMVAGIVSICGASGGSICGATQANQKGQFENVELRNCTVKPMLSSIGADPMGQNPLPDRALVQHLKNHAQRLRSVVFEIARRQGVRLHHPWYFKCAKLCLIWEVWNAAFPDAKWIIVRRDPEGIARSCMKTGFMRKRGSVESWLEWVQYHVDRFEEMKQSCASVVEVWAHDIVKGDLTSTRSVVESFLGLEWDNDKVLAFVTPALWNTWRSSDVKSDVN